jgi:hypothetical protein
VELRPIPDPVRSALGVLHHHATDALTSDDQLHDALRAVAYLEPHHGSHALREAARPAITAEAERSLMDHGESGFSPHPSDRGGFRGMRLAHVAQLDGLTR